MERTCYFDLFGACYSGGALSLEKETARLKIFEVIAGEGLGIVYYDVEQSEYLWDGNKEKSLLDLLTKKFHHDWWCGYPMYIHSDYKAVLARRINLILHRELEEQKAEKEIRSFMKGSLEAWKEQLGCVWDEDKKQFIV
ncbi:MAG TPA: hypothetical protein VK750_01890 [Cytophagaceae bacterium]|jgi:hypothetical protein|nr:hypothetical protein [Cytophagaceae bacterium]